MSIATKKGDSGTTGLYYGGRVKKNSVRIECNGAVDEAQASLGFAHAIAHQRHALANSSLLGLEALDATLVSIERDLWILMAEIATAPANRRKLVPGKSQVTPEMVQTLTDHVDQLEALDVMPKDFVVPGENLVAAALDVARTVVRRAERLAVGVPLGEGSCVVPYLNRLSDVCWLLARAVEKDHLATRDVGPG